MDPKSPGMRRYFHEYLFHQAVEQVKERMAGDRTIMVSGAKALRGRVDALLQSQGARFDDAPIRQVMASIDTALEQGVARPDGESYVPVFGDGTPSSPGYQAMYGRFKQMIGMEGSTGPAGARVPVSPYDPRWSVRSTVKGAGSSLTYVLDEDVAQMAGGSVERLSRLQNGELRLHTLDDSGRAVPGGRALSWDDLTGMTELMGRMTAEEYADVRGWVALGATTQAGQLDRTRVMSPEAIARSAAILDELQAQGVPYKVVRDRQPGQIAAQVEGTKTSVRLTDTRANEAFVGRVWDDGMAVYYASHQADRSAGNKAYQHNPTLEETVKLVNLARGLPVERTDGKGLVGERGTHEERQWLRGQSRTVLQQDAYFVEGGSVSMSMMGPLRGPEGQVVENVSAYVRRTSKERSTTAAWFGTPEAGEDFLRAKVESARENIAASLDVDRLVAEATEHAEEAREGIYHPELSGDTEIAAVQRAYWDVLRGAQDTLLRPGATVEEYEEATAFLAEIDLGPDQREVVHDMRVSEIAYVGTPEQRVRQHAAEVPDGMVGTYDPVEVVAEDGSVRVERFDPVRVAKYMDSEHGAWRNTSDLVAAMRAAGLPGEELRGAGFGIKNIKDRLATFDPESARGLEDLPEGMLKRMAETTRESLERNGVDVTSLAADANGIIAWTGERYNRSGERLPNPLSGQIGQVFEPDELGGVQTRFASGENYLLVPGYEARIVAQRPGEDLSVEERTRLRGYEQQMVDAIRYQVAQDVMVGRTETGEVTSLNGVYRRLYDERLPVDFYERAAERGLGDGWAQDVVSTLARRVRYPDQMGDTFYQAWQRDNGRGADDPANDNYFSALTLSGGRRMATMSGEQGERPYFDLDMTNGSRMGTTFYLVSGASVDAETGQMVPSDDPADRAPLMKRPELEHMRFNAWDRRQMISSMLLHATGVTEPEQAMLTDRIKGWTADDGLVVSTDFAERNRMLGTDGQMRPLVAGDKVSDLHGNKGVISLIVDPQMDLEDARALQIEEAVRTFRDNPGLSVVMSPFSGVSRMNAGTARELMADPRDGVDLDGTVVPGSIGSMRFVVTNKDVEAGTRHYDEEAIAMGRGRRASAQLAWGLGAQGADQVMAEFYGPNGASAANLREMMIGMGLDMAPDGTLANHQLPETAAERRLFEMPELVTTKPGPTGLPALNAVAMRRSFAETIGDKGGDMEMPFPVRFPTGEIVPQTEQGTWRMPVLSSHLRTGQELADGSSAAHDYTNQYLSAYEWACQYRYAQTQLERDDLSRDQRTRLEKRMAEAPGRAQAAFDTITSSLKTRQFSGKHNVFRDTVMSARVPNSATAVWTADPRLELDQVALGSELAEGLGVVDDDHVVIWRDPVLRDAGVRYMRVKVDESITGAAINPVMDKGFDGDFDGDSVGIVKLNGERAKQQARERLSVEANLLDLGQRAEITVDGMVHEVYPLMMQDSLDVKVSQSKDPALTERFAQLTLAANDAHADFEEGETDRRGFLETNKEILSQLNGYYADAMDSSKGRGVTLRFDSAASHLRSLDEACVQTGAKGSPGKLVSYADYFGVDPVIGTDLGTSRYERDRQAALEADRGVMVAVTVKTAVGIAGTYSQRGVKALRNEELKPVLELTYPVTQSQLQSKHDPTEAMNKYDILMGPGRSLWRGRKMEHAAGQWRPAKDEKGNEFQATTQEWVTQFKAMYTGSDGLKVSINPEYVERVAAALSVDGKMVDIEERGVEAALGAKGSTMDRLAYGGTFEDLQAAASRGENLYAGSQNACFTPFMVRRNQRALTAAADAFERRADPTRGVPEPELESVVNRDVLRDGHERARVRGAGRRSDRAVSVRAPRRPDPADLEPVETAPVPGDNDYYSL